MKEVTFEIKPYGPLTALVDDDAETTRWPVILKLSESENIKAGCWGLDKEKLSPKKLGKKDSAAYTKEIVRLYAESPAEAAAYQQEFNRILDLSWKRKIEETVSMKRESIPDEVADFLKNYVRWSAQPGTGAFLYVRSSDANTWAMCENPWTELTYYRPGGGEETALDCIINRVTEMQIDGRTSWGVTSDTDPMTGRATRRYTPFLTAANEGKPSLAAKIAADIRFRMEQPETFSNDPDVPCMSFFPLEDLERKAAEGIGHCRHWINFESQMPVWARDAFRASFYGVFNAKNRSRQIVSLFDFGQTGKTSMYRAVMKVAGRKFCASVSKDSHGNQFWASSVYGSRLVMFSDTGNTKVSLMTKVKQLTGGDPIPVEFKGKTSFSWVPNVRVWTSSNNLPEIETYLRHQRSRMLVIPLTPTNDPEIQKEFCAMNSDGTIMRDLYGDPVNIGWKYDEVLAAEFWSYLLLCREPYQRLCKNDQDIPIPPEMELYIQGGCRPDHAVALQALLTNYLSFSPGAMLTNKDLRALIAQVGTEGKDVILKYSEVKKYLKGVGCLDFHDGVNRGLEGVTIRAGVTVTGNIVKMAKSDRVSGPSQLPAPVATLTPMREA